MSNLSVSKVYQLGLMTAAYIVGELTHFLINTTSKAQVRDRGDFKSQLSPNIAFDQAREIGYGEKSCFTNDSVTQTTPGVNCTDIEEEEICGAQESCYWHYNGLGIEYQVI